MNKNLKEIREQGTWRTAKVCFTQEKPEYLHRDGTVADTLMEQQHRPCVWSRMCREENGMREGGTWWSDRGRVLKGLSSST